MITLNLKNIKKNKSDPKGGGGGGGGGGAKPPPLPPLPYEINPAKDWFPKYGHKY